MSPECHAQPTAGQIPEDARLVGAARSEGEAVGAKRQVVNPVGVASEDVPDDPGRGVPCLDRAVSAARKNGLAVEREDQPANYVSVSGEGNPGLAGDGV